MVKDPFLDPEGPGLQLIARGQVEFLRSALRRQTDNSLVAPDISSFDNPNVVQILDPDGVDVTDTWVTNDLDPNHTPAPDPYDENHVDYVGDLSTGAENLGVFLESYNNGVGSITGRMAQKVKVPLNAEVTTNDADRYYRIRWTLTRGGVAILDPDSGNPYEDAFNVAEVGFLDFGPDSITPAQVRAGYNTPLTDPELENLISEASCNIQIYADRAGCKIGTPPEKAIRQATLYEARLLVIEREITDGRAVNSVSQGGMSLSFEASQSRIDRLTEKVEKFMQAFLAIKCGMYEWKRPRAVILRDQPGTTGRFNFGDFPRGPFWWWRDY